MIFEIDDLKYKINPRINSTIENDIAFYKKYFDDKIQILIDTKGWSKSNKLESVQKAYMLQLIDSGDFKQTPFNERPNLLQLILKILFFIIIVVIVNFLLRS